MRNNNLSIQLAHLLIIVIIVYSLTAIFPRIISRYLTTYFYLLVLVLCFILIFFSRGKDSLNEYLVLVVPFVIWKVFVFFLERQDIISWAYGSVLDIAPVVIGMFSIKRLEYGKIKFLSFVIILAVLATLITTYIGLQQYPTASRYLATVGDASDEWNVRFNMMNIGGYEFIYSTVLMYPIVIYAYKRRKIHLVFAIIFAVFELLVIINSGYTIALLFWMISTMFFFFGRNFRLMGLFFVVVIALVFILFFSDIISDGLKFLADNIDNRYISQRLSALAGGRGGLESSDDNRLELYLLSLNTFIRSPIIGSLGTGFGGHSFILDFLARYGLIGGVLLYSMYYVIFKRFYLPYKNTQGYGYIVWIFVQTLMLSAINTGMWLYILCLFVPILLTFINGGGHDREGALDSKHDS